MHWVQAAGAPSQCAARAEERRTLKEAIDALREEAAASSRYAKAKTDEDQAVAVMEFVGLGLEEAIAFLSRITAELMNMGDDVRALSQTTVLAGEGGRKLMRAIGLIEGPPDPDRPNQKQFVLPEGAEVDELKQKRTALRHLRHAFRTGD